MFSPSHVYIAGIVPLFPKAGLETAIGSLCMVCSPSEAGISGIFSSSLSAWTWSVSVHPDSNTNRVIMAARKICSYLIFASSGKPVSYPYYCRAGLIIRKYRDLFVLKHYAGFINHAIGQSCFPG
jgi:hypothetical protein